MLLAKSKGYLYPLCYLNSRFLLTKINPLIPNINVFTHENETSVLLSATYANCQPYSLVWLKNLCSPAGSK